MAEAVIDAPTKVCTRCTVEKPATLDHFPPHKMGKYHVHSLCRPCKKIDDAERRNRPDQKARQKAWRDANKAYVRDYNAKYRENYTSTADVARWRERNLEKAREQGARRRREQRRRDPAYRLRCRIAARLQAMLSDKAGRTSEDLLGYTCAELRRHIERQFLPGMSWDNAGEWHVDHIVPVSAFNITSADDPDLRVCWALSNLRPMWAKDNISKGNKRLLLL